MALEATVAEPTQVQEVKNSGLVDVSKVAQAQPVDLTTKMLDFLSTASNQMLGSIAVGLSLATWLVLGRLGLILIGVFGGVVLHATWESQSPAAGSSADTRKERGLDVANRILEWRQTSKAVDTTEGKSLDIDGSGLAGKGFEDFRPETASALTDFVEAVIRDYVKWWYTPILPDESFPAACRRTLTSFLRSISLHLSRKRPADAFVDFVTNSSSIMIVFLSELSSALHAAPAGTAPSDAVHEYLLTNPESSLANILNDRQQKRKFKMIAEDILESFLDRSVYGADPARIFLREIMSGVVLEMSLTTCSKPEWINGWVVYLLEDGEPDFSQAIDVGLGSASAEEIDSKGVLTQTKRAEEKRGHKKRLSKAEEAMEEAMEEAKRLSQLIAEEDRKKLQDVEPGNDNGEEATRVADDAEEVANTTSANTSSQYLIPSPQAGAYSGSIASADESRQTPSTTTPGGSRAIVDLASSDDSVGQATPTSGDSTSSQSPPQTPARDSVSSFTNFDQILPPTKSADEQPALPKRTISVLTLHNAHITLHDDSSPADKGKIKKKPDGEYWIQIEPQDSQFPGWMILRRYADLETLHEVLRRIAAISGVNAFLETHRELPDWKAHTKPSLRGELERYLRDACWYQPLAESEGMKRFLEKDNAQASSAGKGMGGLGWPSPAAFETMGKGMLDALTVAPKGVAEGGKAVLGGVTGVFGSIGSSLGPKRRETAPVTGGHSPGRASMGNLPILSSPAVRGHSPGRASTLPLLEGSGSGSPSISKSGRMSEETTRSSPIVQTQPPKPAPMERKSSYVAIADDGSERQIPLQGRRSDSKSRSTRTSASNSREPSRAPSMSGVRIASPREVENMILPPPPSDIPDDYMSPTDSGRRRSDSLATPRSSTTTASSAFVSPSRQSTSSTRPNLPARPTTKPAKEYPPLSESETRVAVELLFATINELYTLSSAWNIRRTLLAAAKTFLLRPGNPSLISIQTLIQDSVINANTSDAGIAQHLLKLRANTMPTEEELAAWPAELTTEEKESLRLRARKLIIERGVPAALVGVMGQAATGEAVGRVFDCLQVNEVARGLMFGLLLQGVRAIAQ